MTKPIILVKICYKLSYAIQGVKIIFDKVTSLSQLISKFLVAPTCLQYCFWLAWLVLFASMVYVVYLGVNISPLCRRT